MSSEHDNDRHEHHHVDLETLTFGLVTISSSRDLEEDSAGDRAEEIITSRGHAVSHRELHPDEKPAIADAVDRMLRAETVDVVLTMGGTGVTPDDVTPEAVRGFLDRELPGFGERFRAISANEIGARVIGSRATAGISRETLIFVLPGSTGAVETALTELILPVAGHLAGLVRRD